VTRLFDGVFVGADARLSPTPRRWSDNPLGPSAGRDRDARGLAKYSRLPMFAAARGGESVDGAHGKASWHLSTGSRPTWWSTGCVAQPKGDDADRQE